MPVYDSDDHAVAGQRIQKRFDMALGLWVATRQLPLRRGPSGVEAVGRGYGKHADVAPCLGDDAGRGNRLVSDRALIGNNDRTVGAGFAQPIGAIDGALSKVVIDPCQRLFERFGCRSQVDRAAGLVAQPGALVPVAFAFSLEVIKSPLHDHGEFVGKAGPERRQAVLAHADQRRPDGLVDLALRRRRDRLGLTSRFCCS